jgi:glycosyltransferase involved in cell wall biosynthesis
MPNEGRGVAVCIIVENLVVPPDRRVWQEANALSAAGYSVSIICPKGLGYTRSRERINDVEIYRHASLEWPGLLGHIIEYVWALAAEFILALRIYERSRFRILHACNPPDTIFLIALFFRVFGVRFIFDHHDLTPEFCQVRFPRKSWLYWCARLAEKLTFRAADVAISTNQSFRQIALLRGGVKADRNFVVRTCPDLKDLAFTPHPHLKRGRRHLVVYVGVMEPQDGLGLLLESIDCLVNGQGREDTLFVLIGFGTEVPSLRSRVADLGLLPWVEFAGPLYGDDLWAYLATADVAVAPDPSNVLNNKLTMIKILEYMAFGLPIVLYDLEEGKRSANGAALHAEANDPVDFASKVGTLLDSESLRQRLGGKGRENILGGMNWEAEKKRLLEAYRTALR